MLRNEDIARLKRVDAIMVLGGEPKTPYLDNKGCPELYEDVPVMQGPRSAKALELYNQLTRKRKGTLYNVLTGRCSGLKATPVSNDETEAVIMGTYLLANRVPLKTLILEDDSLDTIANFIYTRPLLEEHGIKNLALICDGFGMQRALDTGNRILGPRYNLEPLPADEPECSRLVETAVRLTQWVDHRILARFMLGHPLEPGNQEQWEDYLNKMHPFHAEDPAFGLYTFCALRMKAQQSAPKNYQLE